MSQSTAAYQTGCLVCGNELLYMPYATTQTCYYCGVTQETNLYCGHGHYVCDICHSGTANDLIERYCRNTDSVSPLAMAVTLMKNPLVKMHGPEHHFLIPAVLLTVFYNLQAGKSNDLTENLGQARKRAEVVKGGFCGLWGACGAAIGAGIFVSLITGATPLSDTERCLANGITAECLQVIAANGGPRCCKRETFWTILTAMKFVEREFGVLLPRELPEACSFSSVNKECMQGKCRFCGKRAG